MVQDSAKNLLHVDQTFFFFRFPRTTDIFSSFSMQVILQIFQVFKYEWKPRESLWENPQVHLFQLKKLIQHGRPNTYSFLHGLVNVISLK